VTVTGTNFVITPTMDFGYSRLIVMGVTYVGSTSLIVDLRIHNAAKNGSYDVTATNPDTQSDVLLNGFSVV
jgi:hypothetical protein